MSQSAEQMLIAAVYDNSLKLLNTKLSEHNIEVTPKNITSIIKLGMEIAEASELKGRSQTTLVTKIVRKVINDAPISADQQQSLLAMIDNGIVADVITLVVSASKGELNINVAKEVAANCCLAFLKSRQKK